jgi:spore maturation protein CgeB
VPDLVYVGDLADGTTSGMRCEALRSLGFTTAELQTDVIQPNVVLRYADKVARRLRVPIDHAGVNAALLSLRRTPDVLWIDKGNTVLPSTLARLRRRFPELKIVGYSPDDMMQWHCSSIHFLRGLRYYDAFVTTKSFGVAELRRWGCARVVFSENAYDPLTHRPCENPDGSPLEHTIGVGFIGHHEAARCRSITRLCEAGVPVTVTGPGWHRYRRSLPTNATTLPPVFGPAYAARISATLVNLGFLRKMNRDLQTQRTVEVPACGGLLLAERTVEQQRLFAEGVEADYFDDDDELILKCKRYLAQPAAARRIAMAGRERCRSSRYSYQERLADALADIGLLPKG